MHSLNRLISGKDSKRVATILAKAFPENRFTARDVVDFARPKNSPLHQYFEWDNTRAAELYRIEQAKNIIRCTVVLVGGDRVRAFHNVYVAEEDRRVYTTLGEAKKIPELWEQVLYRALDEAVSWSNRYEHLTQFAPAVVAIKELERKYRNEKDKENSGTKGRGKANRNSGNGVQVRKGNAGRRVAVAG